MSVAVVVMWQISIYVVNKINDDDDDDDDDDDNDDDDDDEEEEEEEDENKDGLGNVYSNDLVVTIFLKC